MITFAAMRKCFAFFLLLLLAVLPCSAKVKTTISTRDLQVDTTGQSLCTNQLQQAIDRLAKKGGGTLLLAPGHYLTGGLMLRSGITLQFDEGAVLLGSTNPYHYQSMAVEDTDDQRGDNASMALLMADGAEHVSICGKGVIDGQGLQLALNIDSLHHTGERVDARNTGNPVFMRFGQRAGQRKGSLKNVTIRDFKCEVPFGRPDEAYDLRGPEVDFFHNPFPSSICGIPGNKIQDVLLQNVSILYPGRATKGMAYIPLWRKGDVPEQIQKYPEFTMFGELPSWGFYLRHIDGITLQNVQLKLAADDFRPAIVDEDVDRLLIE